MLLLSWVAMFLVAGFELSRGGDFYYLAVIGDHHSYPTRELLATAAGHGFGGAMKGEQIGRLGLG